MAGSFERLEVRRIRILWYKQLLTSDANRDVSRTSGRRGVIDVCIVSHQEECINYMQQTSSQRAWQDSSRFKLLAFSLPIPGSSIVRVVSFNELIRGLEWRADSRNRVAHLGSRSKIAVLCHALYDDRQSIYRQRMIIVTQIDSRCYDTPLAVL